MIMIPREHEQTMLSDAENAYPNECCGVIFGKIDSAGVKYAERAQSIANAREGDAQRNRFLITPEDMMRAEQTARAAKLEVIGFYHSHPDHPAAPSDYDKRHALPFYSYVIISVKKGAAEDLLSWELELNRENFALENILKKEEHI